MQKDLTQLFKETAPQAPENLSGSIFAAIETAAARRARMQRYIWGGFSLVSLGALVASGSYAAHSASTTGFTSYFSLIFSDSGAAASLWREVGLSLLESLPVFGTIIVLASISAMLWSLRNFSKYTGGKFTLTTSALASAA